MFSLRSQPAISGLVKLLGLYFQSVLPASEAPAPRFPLLPAFLSAQVHGCSLPGAKGPLSILLLKWHPNVVLFSFCRVAGEKK